MVAALVALTLAASPAGPGLRLLPELAEAQGDPAFLPDPYRNGIHPGEALAGAGMVLAATAGELFFSWPFLLLAVRRAAPGDERPLAFTAAGLLYLQLATLPLAIAALQERWSQGRVSGGWDTAIVYGYAVELVAATLLSAGIAVFPAFWVMFGLAAAVHVLAMPAATSLGLHVDRGGVGFSF